MLLWQQEAFGTGKGKGGKSKKWCKNRSGIRGICGLIGKCGFTKGFLRAYFKDINEHQSGLGREGRIGPKGG